MLQIESGANYKATVVRITNLRPHTNADKLICTNIFGNNVIVGKDTQIGDLGVYFVVESQLSEEFSKANDLIRRKDENGKAAGGMLEANRRIKCISLRGEKSMGLWMPIECMNRLFSNGKALDTWNEGYEFDEYLKVPICQKYVPKTNNSNKEMSGKKARQPRESKIIPNQFRFHGNTSHLGKNTHKIAPNDLIVITWKMHGTSAIVSNCLVKRK